MNGNEMKKKNKIVISIRGKNLCEVWSLCYQNIKAQTIDM